MPLPSGDDLRDAADSGLRTATGDRVGVSDDFTSTEDATGSDVSLSSDFTSTDDSGGVLNVLSSGYSAADSATRSMSDTVLDNERFSIQDTARTGLAQAPMSAAYSLREGEATWLDDDEVAEGFRQLDDEITETVEGAVEGTALDNTGTDALRWAGDNIVLEGARIGIGTSTGIDTREGETDYTPGLAEAADIGLTVGTAGAGAAATRGLRSADEGSGALSRLTSRFGDDASDGQRMMTDGGQPADGGLPDVFNPGRDGDGVLPAVRDGDGAATATRSTDDATRTAEDGDALLPAARDGDRAGDPFTRAGNRFGGDDAAQAGTRSSDDALTATRSDDGVFRVDDASRAGTRSGDDAAQVGARTGDDAASAGSRTGDDAARATRTGDDGGSLSQRIRDRIGQASARTESVTSRAGQASARARQRAGQALRGATPSRRTAALVGGGAAALVGGGALYDTFRDTGEMVVETEDGDHLRIMEETNYPEIEEHRPHGGTLVSVHQDGAKRGYSIITRIEGRTVYLLDSDSEEISSTVDMAEFEEALQRGVTAREDATGRDLTGETDE